MLRHHFSPTQYKRFRSVFAGTNKVTESTKNTKTTRLWPWVGAILVWSLYEWQQNRVVKKTFYSLEEFDEWNRETSRHSPIDICQCWISPVPLLISITYGSIIYLIFLSLLS